MWPMETIVPLSGAVRTDIRPLCSDSEVSDDDFSSGGGGGARAPADETAVCCAQLDDFDWVVPDRVPDMLVSMCVTKECLSVLRHINEILPDVLPGISTGGDCCAGVLAIVDEMVSSAVLVEGAAPVVVFPHR